MLSPGLYYHFVAIFLRMWLTISKGKEDSSERAEEREDSLRKNRKRRGERVVPGRTEEGHRELQWHNKDCLEPSSHCAVWGMGTNCPPPQV